MTIDLRQKRGFKIYAFDIDETLEISRGPVSLLMMEELRGQGHIVGLIGNWGLFVQVIPDWHRRISFFGTPMQYERDGVRRDKEDYMIMLQRHIPADDYVMVGNILGITGVSDDQGSAMRAGWRFICERDFANGVR